MLKLLHYFNELKTKHKKTFQILDDLIDLFYFKITSDTVSFDIRTVNLHHREYSIIIKSKIIFNNNYEKKEYIEIKFNNMIFDYIANYL